MGEFIANYWFEILTMAISAIPTIILLIIKGRISHWFNKELESHRSQLDQKVRHIQSTLDNQLESMKIEFGLIQPERLKIIRAIHKIKK